MKALTFQIRLLQPLLVTQVGAGEENSATAFDFISGSIVRGDLVNRYLRQRRITDAAADPSCRRLFFDGGIRYLNAYPTNRLEQRMLPAPLSWRISKNECDEPHVTIYDFAAELDDDVENLVSPPGVFCWREREAVEFYHSERYIGVHNASEHRNVKRKGESTVYRYEAIASGAVFSMVIASDDEADLQILRPLLDGQETNLGGSRSAGYGRVRCEKVHLDHDWCEYEADDEPDEDIVIVTLLSDAILRDKNGQCTTDPTAMLQEKPSRAYLRTRIVGGFNRKWGLPLVQVPALQAGSVFVYQADQGDRQILRQLEQEGIGERRTEGFGRIAVNWHTQAKLHRRPVPQKDIPPVGPLSAQSQALAQQMAERRLRAVLEQKLIAAVSTLTIDHPLRSKAQLSRLRLAARRAWREGTFQTILDHLENLNREAKGQFERARIGNERFSSWLDAGVRQNKIWADWLNPTLLPSLAGVTAQPTDDLRLEYTVRLLEALLKKASKEPGAGGAQ